MAELYFPKWLKHFLLRTIFVSVGALVFDSVPTANQMQPCGALYVYIYINKCMCDCVQAASVPPAAMQCKYANNSIIF